MCAAISEDGVVGCRPVLGSYNTEHLIDFLNELEQACQGNLCYRVGQYQFPPCRACSGMVSGTSSFHDQLPSPYSPFLNPIEEFFSTWKWKVYDRHPHEHVTLLQAMDEACGDIIAEQCQA